MKKRDPRIEACMNVKALFLDLDGTLHDFEPAAMAAMERVYDMVIAKYPSINRDELVREYSGIWAIARNHAFSDGKGSWGARDERLGALLSRFGIKDEDLVGKLVNEYGVEYLKSVKPFDHAVAELDKLHRLFDIYIITDGADGQRLVVESLGIARFLKDIYTASDSGSPKRNGELFRYALKKSLLLPEEVIAVGDLYERDIKGAGAAGIRSIWLNRDGVKTSGDECPSMISVIKDIRELGNALERSGIVPAKCLRSHKGLASR